ncbi:MAG TPA: hypothetical protein VHT97_09770 [Acidimicrobiales bacterium]|jgi:hypothetical protein|nr:hypothetical protein [Acidimicrobiales bacterium]
MILWPTGVALGLVWLVFRDPAFDYRMVVVGALVPDVVDAPFGGARLAHTLMGSVAVLTGVMLATRGRRHLRRSLLALPIGMFAHLVADGMWARTDTFWWPFFGRSLTGRLPALDHGVAVLVMEELVGAVLVAWCWRRFRLSDPAVRATFLRTGHLPRDVLG